MDKQNVQLSLHKTGVSYKYTEDRVKVIVMFTTIRQVCSSIVPFSLCMSVPWPHLAVISIFCQALGIKKSWEWSERVNEDIQHRRLFGRWAHVPNKCKRISFPSSIDYVLCLWYSSVHLALDESPDPLFTPLGKTDGSRLRTTSGNSGKIASQNFHPKEQ